MDPRDLRALTEDLLRVAKAHRVCIHVRVRDGEGAPLGSVYVTQPNPYQLLVRIVTDGLGDESWAVDL